MIDRKLGRRRLMIRMTLVICIFGVAVLMYNIGKEYSVLLDNETTSINGEKYDAIEYGSLVIDGDDENPVDIWEDDRILQKLVGINHNLLLKVLDGNDNVVKSVERKIKLDFDTRQWMISLSAIAGKAETVLVPNPAYTGEPEVIPDEEESESPENP